MSFHFFRQNFGRFCTEFLRTERYKKYENLVDLEISEKCTYPRYRSCPYGRERASQKFGVISFIFFNRVLTVQLLASLLVHLSVQLAVQLAAPTNVSEQSVLRLCRRVSADGRVKSLSIRPPQVQDRTNPDHPTSSEWASPVEQTVWLSRQFVYQLKNIPLRLLINFEYRRLNSSHQILGICGKSKIVKFWDILIFWLYQS